MNKKLGIFLMVLALAGCSSDKPAKPKADRIFINGKVWTGNDAQPTAQAMAISGDKIVAVGTTAEIRALASDETEVVDLKNRRVVPGFQDSHTHFLMGSANKGRQIELDDAETLEEVQRRVAEHAAANPDAGWIIGGGWGYAAFPGNTVDKKYLDEVVLDRPVYLESRDGHMGFGNSKALELAGITRDTQDPPNGRIIKGKNGEPTGEVQESAQRLIRKLIPEPTFDQVYNAFIQAMDEAAAAGITAMQDAATSLEDLSIYEKAEAAGKLKIRFSLAPMMVLKEGLTPDVYDSKKGMDSAAALAKYAELRDRYTGPLIRLVSVKGILDGTIDAKTAAMFEPYVGGGTGLPFLNQDEIDETVALYDKAGFQVLIHAIGDKAINMSLNAFEHAQKVNGSTDHRHRVEHAEMPKLSDVPRFKKLGAIASTQPMFANPDATVLENFAVLLGPERAQYADSFSIYDDAGVVQVFGSDYPVMTYDVLRGIEVARTRMTENGTPPGGWYPKGCISVEAALRHYTVDAAYGTFQEDVRGTLTAGKYADFVVLSRDILEIDPTEISETDVLLTVMGGKNTYRSIDF
ncbi:MAG: amidohydrolase [Candidatus Aminicenantes bacterium]|nr:amidohydrolase [Candidatus Aminicenantes bacterium]